MKIRVLRASGIESGRASADSLLLGGRLLWLIELN